jgi:hypothetical protein
MAARPGGASKSVRCLMACEYICDGCGKCEPVIFNGGIGWRKPTIWFQRTDQKDGPQDACSRECIEKIAAKTGKTDIVLPL